MNKEAKIVLEVVAVSKEFSQGKDALSVVDDVTFQITAGECFGIIGESGCGKSTLAKLITGVEKVSSGELYFNGQDITKLQGRKLRNLRRDIQMIFQNPLSVISPRMKIKDFLLEPYINYKILSKREALLNIQHILQQVHLPVECLEKYPHQLSGGELQRVCIARAFGLNPQLLICDEITSALDVSVQNDIMCLFKQMQEEYRISCAFICHDLALVNKFTDRVMVMYLGQAVEIMDSSKLGTCALHPYTQGLLKSILIVRSDKSEKLAVMKGEPDSPNAKQQYCRFSSRCPKATRQCFESRPPMREVSTGHFLACFNTPN